MVIVRALAAESDTVKLAAAVPASPSATVASAIEIEGGASSSVIVPIALPSRTVALVGLVSVASKVSFGSSSAS